MKEPLNDKILWTKRGVSVIWSAYALSELGSMTKALSVRDFFRWRENGWIESNEHFTGNEKRTVVVAGIDAVIDSLEPGEAETWLQQNLLPCTTDFQDEVAGGGQEAALIFWMVDKKRFRYETSTDSVRWRCSTAYSGRELPIIHCLWNGAQSDIRRIVPTDCDDQEHGIGFFLQRIS